MLKLNGVHLRHHKHTAKMEPIRMPAPEIVNIPMAMHIGAPAIPIVKPMEDVKVGQLIAEGNGAISSPIYSSVSGKVKKLDRIRMPSGDSVRSIIIENDGENRIHESVVPHDVSTKEEFIEAVKMSGVVGLGGAGFPTAVKLNVSDDKRIEYLIVNGAECEPYITADTRTMIDRADELVRGILMIKKFLGIEKIIIGIENNKQECISNLSDLTKEYDFISVMPLASYYPQGGEKVLIYHTTGRVVREGTLPLDIGVVVINCTTVVSIVRYIETGMPLIEKSLTVDGSAIKSPKNVIVPIGTPAEAVIEFTGGYSKTPGKVLFGGPMMGVSLLDVNLPVMKNTNAILAFSERDSRHRETTACIRCGRCTMTCPVGLAPVIIERAYAVRNIQELERLKANLCMECGCCSYVCPAKRELAQTNILAKNLIIKAKRAKMEGGEN